MDLQFVSGTSGPMAFYMHALNLDKDGEEEPGFPVEIQGTAANDPEQTFTPNLENQRAGLLLLGGVVYVAFAAHCDIGRYQGWIVGVSESGTSPPCGPTRQMADSAGGGIWMSGGGLVSDGPGTILFTTGNGISAGDNPNGTIPGTLRRQTLVSPSYGSTCNPTGASSSRLLRALRRARSRRERPGLRLGKPDRPTEPVLRDPVDPEPRGRGREGGLRLSAQSRQPRGRGRGSLRHRRRGRSVRPERRCLVESGRLARRRRVGLHPDGVRRRAGGSTGFMDAYQYGLSGSGTPRESGRAVLGRLGFGSSAPVVTSNGTTSGSALMWVVWSPDASGSAPSFVRTTRYRSTASSRRSGTLRSARLPSSTRRGSVGTASTWGPAVGVCSASDRQFFSGYGSLSHLPHDGRGSLNLRDP